jgi:hypothetical protein
MWYLTSGRRAQPTAAARRNLSIFIPPPAPPDSSSLLAQYSFSRPHVERLRQTPAPANRGGPSVTILHSTQCFNLLSHRPLHFPSSPVCLLHANLILRHCGNPHQLQWQTSLIARLKSPHKRATLIRKPAKRVRKKMELPTWPTPARRKSPTMRKLNAL